MTNELSTELIELHDKALDALRDGKLDEALELSKKGVKLAETSGSVALKALAYFFLMETEYDLGDYISMFSAASKLDTEILSECPENAQGTMLGKIAELYLKIPIYDFALDTAIRALSKPISNVERAAVLLLIASIKEEAGSYNEALLLLQRACSLTDDVDNSMLITSVLISMARTNRKIGNYIEAFKIIEKAQQVCESLNDPVIAQWCKSENMLLSNKASDYTSIIDTVTDFEESLVDLEESLRNNGYIGTYDDVMNSILAFAEFCLQVGRLDDSLDLYNKARKYYDKNTQRRFLPQILLGCGICHLYSEQYSKALEQLLRCYDIVRFTEYFRMPLLCDCVEAITALCSEAKIKCDILRLCSITTQLKSINNSYSRLLPRLNPLSWNLLKEVDVIVDEIRGDMKSYFIRDGIKVELNSGKFYDSNDKFLGVLAFKQKRVFRCLVENMGHPMSNADLIRSYEPMVDKLDEIPRRAQYFISALRIKLGNPEIINVLPGVGYFIPE